MFAQAPMPKVTVPRVGIIDFYGLRKLSADKLKKQLGLQEGGPLPGSRLNLEEQLDQIPGVVRSHIEAMCCTDGAAILFVGIEERGAPIFSLRSDPDGEMRLPDEVTGAWTEFQEAVQAAVHMGITAEDLRSGHALSADPTTRVVQKRFSTLAELYLPVIRDVLRNSADEEERTIAAYVIGYAPVKRLVVDDLQYALQDPAPTVRGNAISALKAIAVLASRDSELGIRISPTWFVEMLHSPYFSDRTRAVNALLDLTEENDTSTLDLIRERGLDSLSEMARWNSLEYAVGSYMLLSRVGKIPADEARRAWSDGQRERVIGTVLETARKSH